MTALSAGCTLSASIVACAKNGRNVSLTPSRAWNASLARSRSLAMFVTSTSTTVVSCAEVCRDSIIRLAMTWRGRDIRWVLPRSADGTIEGRAGAAAGAGALGASAGAAWAAAVASAAAAAAAAWAAASASAARCTRAASRTSCLRIRPPTPVPAIASSGTACSAASLRTSGVTYGESPDGSGAGSGYASAGSSSAA